MPPKPKAKKTKPLGRPPVAAEDRRTALIRVLVTEDEHKELQDAADTAGLSLSTWVRSTAISAARRKN